MNKYFIEFLGSMIIMFVIFATDNWFAIGAVTAIAILLGGPISSAAYNPAVAIALYAANKLPEPDLMPYIIAEILGSLGAFYAYKYYVNIV
jgi:glycerol uptake facilitator-like aquaporin